MLMTIHHVSSFAKVLQVSGRRGFPKVASAGDTRILALPSQAQRSLPLAELWAVIAGRSEQISP